MLGKSGGAGGRKGLKGGIEEQGVVGDAWCGEEEEFVQGGGVKDDCHFSETQGCDPRVF